MRQAPPPTLGDYCRALPQHLLPQHALSRLVHAVTRSRRPWLRKRLIDGFLNRFPVELSEAERENPGDYDSFNDFFSRALKPDARPLANAPVLSPVDGRISQLGQISAGRLFQAKRRWYRFEELLGRSGRQTDFENGRFCTIYLAPHNYHRIHMPMSGQLTALRHLPGRLFSVNPATTRVIPGLFARNERVVAEFDTKYGPMAVVMVGALLVGSIETVWTGEITPPTRLQARELPLPPASQRALAQGAELGRFNMGSTVILMLPEGAPAFDRRLYPTAALRMGQALVQGD
ncbi:archaetidylserine decarboxylase [Gammaproteobacteria bacterium AB-CW1]|uniref:Phosphatidylserine decarboxylase proenzyme n=1 Tax=Natronospira elongata TaxID=3110268 RepID=A0AAP6JDQ2_9GAMM|nr:archaetidylserine decarboxylase [Gammaproteobacteria bacterium AB-CW1]